MKKSKKQPSYNSQKLVAVLRELGHTGIKVRWEPLGGAAEMCGPSGGWFFASDQQSGVNPLATSIASAIEVARLRYGAPLSEGQSRLQGRVSNHRR